MEKKNEKMCIESEIVPAAMRSAYACCSPAFIQKSITMPAGDFSIVQA